MFLTMLSVQKLQRTRWIDQDTQIRLGDRNTLIQSHIQNVMESLSYFVMILCSSIMTNFARNLTYDEF